MMNRRDALRWIGATGLAGVAANLGSGIPDLLGAPRAAPARGFEPDVELALVAEPAQVQVIAGAPTRVWRYSGAVVKGPAEALQVIPGSYLGPVIRLRRGQNVRIRFTNKLPESSIVHWHGLDVPSAMDGHPHRAIDTDAVFVYEFTVINRAGTYWYHPHPHGRTGSQVYYGLAGMLIVSDDEEDAAGLPGGQEELPVVLQDRRFDDANQFVYVGNGMMDRMDGFVGDRILVNGRERPEYAVATRAYRLRVLNGSNARFYKLAWDDGTPMTVVGVDGGLLERPMHQAYVMLAPAQRADVIIDLGAKAVGTSLRLRSAPFPADEVGMGAMSAMMGGGVGPSPVPNGAALDLLTLRVARRESSDFRLPGRLSTFDASWSREPDLPSRRIALTFQRGQWLIGGRTFEMMDTAPDEEVAAGSSQVWELANSAGMMGMQMAHPIHMHGRQFRVLERIPAAGTAAGPGSAREGLIDQGWHDTVLVFPGETVRIQAHFSRYPGLYLYHCHILEHEDMGMMRNFRVKEG